MQQAHIYRARQGRYVVCAGVPGVDSRRGKVWGTDAV